MPRILRGDDVDLLQRCDRPFADVGQVADGRRHQVQRSGRFR